MNIRIVLVQPREAGNVGAAARAMKNFGVTDLWIVGPRPQRADNVSEWWAAGADDVMNNARRAQTVAEAIADATLSVATTAATHGRHVFEQLTPADVANLAGADDTVAIVFGREESGLSAADIAACQRTAVIPTWPEFPTMNLAQSVAIFCYELRKGLRPPLPPREAAPMHLVQLLNAEARALLEEAGFFGAMSADRICAELQALEGRVMLTTREASLLLGLVRKLKNS